MSNQSILNLKNTVAELTTAHLNNNRRETPMKGGFFSPSCLKVTPCCYENWNKSAESHFCRYQWPCSPYKDSVKGLHTSSCPKETPPAKNCNLLLQEAARKYLWQHLEHGRRNATAVLNNAALSVRKHTLYISYTFNKGTEIILAIQI